MYQAADPEVPSLDETMDEDEDPNLVISGKSQHVLVDGMRFAIEIYRSETDEVWILEVVDPEGASHVWDDTFADDRDARTAALTAIQEHGPIAFMRGDNVIRFPGE